MHYDIIGDIHGHASKLTALLHHLGYRPLRGAWRHSERTAVFVGDFIDRGPEQLEVIGIVRGMIDAGAAQAVMGNHELNAVTFFLPRPGKAGDHIRTRNGRIGVKNRAQHQAFLDAVGEDSAVHKGAIDWILTLPLWLDLPGAARPAPESPAPGIRVVHACWDRTLMDSLSAWLAPGNKLTLDLVREAAEPGHWANEAIDVLLKGPEFRLPAGSFYLDAGGSKRTKTRSRWWDSNAVTVRELAVLPASALAGMPDSVVVGVHRPDSDNSVATFFGHYWESGTPGPAARTKACVDYSAGKGGDLVAYRWDGEVDLMASKFASAQALAAEPSHRPRRSAP